jgi:cis-3-alkyl-4-acyloxetan-2-one decarboxylase
MDVDVPDLPRWLRAMFPDDMRRRMVDVGDGQSMHVAEWGPANGTPVVMVHGNPSWGLLYRKVVAELVERGARLRLIVPDLIGLGLSTKPRDAAQHSLVQHGAWLAAMLDALALDQMILVVQDWGGPIAMSAVRDRLDRVAALVILNTVLGPPRPGFKPNVFHRFARMPVVSDLAFRVGGFPQNMMAFAQGDRSSIVGKNLFGYVWPLRHIRDRAGPLALARMVPDSHDHPSVPELERCQDALLAFTGPIAVVWGERDPILGRVIGHLERMLPRAEVTRTSAGHFLQEEVPGPIADAIVSVAARAQAN